MNPLECDALLDRAAFAARIAPTAGEGTEVWVLVPVEPTPGMITAGVSAAINVRGSQLWGPVFYKAAVAAAPRAPWKADLSAIFMRNALLAIKYDADTLAKAQVLALRALNGFDTRPAAPPAATDSESK